VKISVYILIYVNVSWSVFIAAIRSAARWLTPPLLVILDCVDRQRNEDSITTIDCFSSPLIGSFHQRHADAHTHGHADVHLLHRTIDTAVRLNRSPITSISLSLSLSVLSSDLCLSLLSPSLSRYSFSLPLSCLASRSLSTAFVNPPSLPCTIVDC
jgi:hypothetical protein